jgi:TPR repeat protein
MRSVGAAFFLFLFACFPARADFMNALSAYDAGAYGVAFTEWRRLAEHGDVDAQVALAGLYEAGLGVRRDDRRAAHWYRTAAERGNVIARLNIGDFYSRGRGVDLDRVKAWYRLDLAASAGSVWARKRRDEVAARMTPDQIRQAEAMASRH